MEFISDPDTSLTIYHLRLPQTIDASDTQSMEMFYGVLDQINMASGASHNLLNIYCAGMGGHTDIAYQLINGIAYAQKNEKADIFMIVNGPCLSAHATIVLAGDKIEIQKYGIYFLFHKGSGGFSNDEPYVKVMEYRQYMLELQRQTERELGLYDLLTKKEKAMYEKGEDVLVIGEDMRKRLKKLGKEVW